MSMRVIERRYGEIEIFGEMLLREYLESIKIKVISSIENESENYLLNVSDVDYIKHKTDQAKVDELVIDEASIYASSEEKMIPSEYFPSSFSVQTGKKYKKDVIKFHVPFGGNKDLLYCMPDNRSLWTISVGIGVGEFTFEVINFDGDVEKIKRQKNSNMESVLKQLENVLKQVRRYNNSIEVHIRSAFESRKNELLRKNHTLASLGVPIKKAENVSSTFSIPAPTIPKKISVDKPVVYDSKFSPEPSLDNETYEQILQIIHDVGRLFERLPSLYERKCEEDLRDFFLMHLEPRFEGAATGETFNKTGKTDILLRHEGTNVFIAECKFWKGRKSFLDTISQLLGYLTWRDSKAAVIMFVQNKSFSSVLETAKEVASEHPNHVKFINTKDETWFNYLFHLSDDRNRMLNLAVMLYHMPK